jgi:release factor glutamine methyltransferase
MATVREVLAETARRLATVTETPDFEATLLAGHAWGWDRTHLIMNATAVADTASLEPLVLRRLAHEPVAYILGNWEFFSLEFDVTPPLLVPRPETEHLVEVALDFLGESEGRVLDLCTGTGCIILSIAKNTRGGEWWATDLNPLAVSTARANAARHGVALNLVEGDLFAPLPADAGPFDVIVSNPPYVEERDWEGLAPDIRNYEDPLALLSGSDGLDCIRRIVAQAQDWLVPGGFLALEMGETQGPALRTLLAGAGYEAIKITKDLAGHDRIASGRKPISATTKITKEEG